MDQPSKKTGKKKPTKPAAKKKAFRTSKKPPGVKYGVSKLEDRFARNFLDRLGVEYVRQYEAKSIGRFFDFYLPRSNVVIEVDGDYWHGNPLIYENGPVNWTQRRAKAVDELKNRWAANHGIRILRVWEHDINNNAQQVLEWLKRELAGEIKKNKLLESRKRNKTEEK